MRISETVGIFAFFVVPFILFSLSCQAALLTGYHLDNNTLPNRGVCVLNFHRILQRLAQLLKQNAGISLVGVQVRNQKPMMR